MIGITSGIALLILGLVAVTLQRLYSAIPARELRRLARRHDHLAAALYRPVAYGASLRLLLWLLAGLSLAGGLILVLSSIPAYGGFGVLVAVFAVVFVWAPTMRLTVHKAQFAAFVAPSLTKVLYYTHHQLGTLAHAIGRLRDLTQHSRMYEKEDLLELLARQKAQHDNRMSHEELETAERALAFTDKRAADIVRPRGDVAFVNADDAIGPILLDQLHKSGQSSFLAYKDKPENIIGSLSLRDALAAKQGGRVFDLVRSDLTYVHEDFTLRQVFMALQKTDQYVAVVINAFEEFVGVITLGDLMHDLLGESAEDNVNYGNRSEVAAYKPHDEPEVELVPEELETKGSSDGASSSEATEVVE